MSEELRELSDDGSTVGIFCNGHISYQDFWEGWFWWMWGNGYGYGPECDGDACPTCCGRPCLDNGCGGPGPSPRDVKQVWVVERPQCEIEDGERCEPDCDCELWLGECSPEREGARPVTWWHWG